MKFLGTRDFIRFATLWILLLSTFKEVFVADEMRSFMHNFFCSCSRTTSGGVSTVSFLDVLLSLNRVCS